MKKIIKISIVFISIMWVFHTFSKNFLVDPAFETFISRKDQILTNESLWVFMIRIHISLAIVSLITGSLGFIKAIRVKSINFHRWNGRIYVLSIVLNFIPGVYVSLFATGGWFSTIGFLILNTLWLVTTILSYLYIKRRKMILHSQWMIRSFFLSLANMTIYIIVAITHNLLNFPYENSYMVAVWLCWIINLLFAELIIRKKVLS
ncbi:MULTISPECIES: DUF2306 domain-containing protein [Metabacillus]|uniref:DUF2306 domain-containing protein n=2 Tax=Metabacillus TaxID=2675233 RepID=A0A179SK81_9BACI|nr:MULTISPECIES: DUF2306 domain-containing protein [Metabacillus]OAS82115.1 hypothetical protein A6K24_13735 [Metabacillus litoralis]QNF29780.1 DUF2306 domain-containing protein [Metabacillus sp. KUDC1714]